MAGPLLQPLLLLLLSLALVSAGRPAHGNGERIINGVPCPRGTHPWQVILYHNNVYECSGVLINKCWVLTIAHCHKSDYMVHMGSDLLVDEHAIKMRASKSFIHPLFNSTTLDHDIMLVKLDRPVKLSSNVKAIKLTPCCKEPGTNCTVSGWGRTAMEIGGTHPPQLICSNVNIVSYNECSVFYPTMLEKHMICAAASDGLSTICEGDSGSPLICEGTLVGVVSSGISPCTWPYAPVIYTRICMYRKWIYNTMKSNT